MRCVCVGGGGGGGGSELLKKRSTPLVRKVRARYTPIVVISIFVSRQIPRTRGVRVEAFVPEAFISPSLLTSQIPAIDVNRASGSHTLLSPRFCSNFSLDCCF